MEQVVVYPKLLGPQSLETEEVPEVEEEGEVAEDLEWIEVVCEVVKWAKDINLEKIYASLDGTCHDYKSLRKISM